MILAGLLAALLVLKVDNALRRKENTMRFFSWFKVGGKFAKGFIVAAGGAALTGALASVLPVLQDGGAVLSANTITAAAISGALLGLKNYIDHKDKPSPPSA